jgi:hypothetical protein
MTGYIYIYLAMHLCGINKDNSTFRFSFFTCLSKYAARNMQFRFCLVCLTPCSLVDSADVLEEPVAADFG